MAGRDGAEYVRLVGSNGVEAEVDSISGIVVTIPTEHHQVHDEVSYSCVDYDADVDIAAPKWWIIVTTDTADRHHFVLQISADGAFLAEIFEGITSDDPGTALTPVNSDRNSANTTSLIFGYDPTNPAGGTKIFNDLVGTTNPKTRFGGTMRNGAEYILKQNVKYGIKITVVADDTKVAMVAEFYEK